MAKKPNGELNKPESAKAKERAKMTGAVKSGDAVEIIKASKLDAKNIIGELGDAFIAEEKAAKHRKEWGQLTMAEQNERVTAAKERATSLVASIVAAIYQRGGVESVEAQIATVNFKPGEKTMKLGLAVVQSPETLELMGNGVSAVKIVFADVDQFDGPMMTEVQPDEPGLPLGDDDKAANDAEAEEEETGEIKDPPPGGEAISDETRRNAERRPEG